LRQGALAEAEVELARVGFGVGDELLQVLAGTSVAITSIRPPLAMAATVTKSFSGS
jgi:hypothetical protein